VSRQAKVVVGAEHDDAIAIDDRLRAFVAVEGLVEGIESHGLRVPGEAEGSGFVEDVAAGDIVVAVQGKSFNRYGAWDIVVGQGFGLGGQRA
jgi:hypothetical protein